MKKLLWQGNIIYSDKETNKFVIKIQLNSDKIALVIAYEFIEYFSNV